MHTNKDYTMLLSSGLRRRPEQGNVAVVLGLIAATALWYFASGAPAGPTASRGTSPADRGCRSVPNATGAGTATVAWSFQSASHADLSASPVDVPLPKAGDSAVYYFQRLPAHIDNPPRPECGTNNLYLCELRVNLAGCPSVRAVATDRCFFATAQSTTDFGDWVDAGPEGGAGLISAATNHFCPEFKVTCQFTRVRASEAKPSAPWPWTWPIAERQTDTEWYQRAVRGAILPE